MTLCAAACLAAPQNVAGQEVTSPWTTDAPTVWTAIAREAAIYVDDSKALFLAPFHWDSRQIATAAGAAALTGGLMFLDENTAQRVQDRASPATAKFSQYVTPIGGWVSYAAPAVLIVSGIAFKDNAATTIGREGLEAVALSDLITSVLKPVFGRQRPRDSNNENVFEPFSGNYSFPSGHATVAFALASVVSARSEGWVIPTVSYTLATAVAYCRVNDKAHFPSDVLAGGVIGTVVGRFIVHRHERAEARAAAPAGGLEVSVYAIHNGLGMTARF